MSLVFVTTGTSLTVPAGLLTTGVTYFAIVRSVSSDEEPTTRMRRSAMRLAYAEAVTSTFSP